MTCGPALHCPYHSALRNAGRAPCTGWSPAAPPTPALLPPRIRNVMQRYRLGGSSYRPPMPREARIWLGVSHVRHLHSSDAPAALSVVRHLIRIIRTGTGVLIPPSASASVLAGHQRRTGRNQSGRGVRHREPRRAHGCRLLPPHIHTPRLGRRSVARVDGGCVASSKRLGSDRRRGAPADASARGFR